MSTPLMRTVVIEMTDECYRVLAQEATNVGYTLGDLLIGHAFVLSIVANDQQGKDDRAAALLAVWERVKRDTGHPMELDIEFNLVGPDPAPAPAPSGVSLDDENISQSILDDHFGPRREP